MANDALFIGWGAAVRGREEHALEVFQETIAFWEEARANGRIESYEPWLLEPHGGELGGFMLARGDRTQLDALRADPGFQRLMARAAAVVDDLGIVSAFGEEALGRQLGFFQEAAGALA
ncbi:MAG: hypothetical protein WBC33_10385, partial [Conexibacter sp.]